MLEALLTSAGLAMGVRHRLRRRLGARRQDPRGARGAASARRRAGARRGRQARARRQHSSRSSPHTSKPSSAEALDSTSQTFLELATAKLAQFQEGARGDLEARQKAVDSLVQPIKESLTKVDGKLGEIERTRIDAYSALHEQLRNLTETQLPLVQKATTSLANAMRQPTVRGRWGELQLKRVVELAGMLEHCDFVEQPTGTSERRAPAPRRHRHAAGRRADHHRREGAVHGVLGRARGGRRRRAHRAPGAPRVAGARARHRAQPQRLLGDVPARAPTS